MVQSIDEVHILFTFSLLNIYLNFHRTHIAWDIDIYLAYQLFSMHPDPPMAKCELLG